MKTPSELNSRWWWRLIKVLYITCAIFIFVITVLILYIINKTANPQDVENYNNFVTKTCSAEEESLQANIYLTELPKNQFFTRRDLIKSLNDFQQRIYKVKETGDILEMESMIGGIQEFPLMLLANNNTIENVEICDDGFWGCTGDDIEKVKDVLVNERQDAITVNSIDYHKHGKILKEMSELHKELYEIMKQHHTACTFTGITQDNPFFYGEHNFVTRFRTTMPSIDREYRGIEQWFYIIIGSFFAIFVIIGASWVFRGVAYYTILGKFNPEK